MSHQITENEILQYIPQQKPFRFIDHILSFDSQSIVGEYTFKPDESFYAGHFPNNPLTPGVILLECMAQIGVVAFGISLLLSEQPDLDIKKFLILFSDAEVEFMAPVFPEDRVTVKAQKIFWRKMKLKSKIEMFNQQGKLVASCCASGIGIRQS